MGLPLGSIYRRPPPDSINVSSRLANGMVNLAYTCATKVHQIGYSSLVVGLGITALSRLKQIKGTKPAAILFSLGALLSFMGISTLLGKRRLGQIDTQIEKLSAYLKELANMGEWGRAFQLAWRNHVALNFIGIHTDEFSNRLREYQTNLLQQGARFYFFDTKNIPFDPMFALPVTEGKSIEQWCQNLKDAFTNPSEEQIGEWSKTTNFNAIFSKLGMVETIEPSLNTYQAVALHYAPLEQMREQVNFLIQQWRKGIRFQSIIYLPNPNIDITLQVKERIEFQFLWDSYKGKGDLPADLIAVSHDTFYENTLTEQLAKFENIDQPILFVTAAPFVPLQDLLNRQASPHSGDRILNQETVGPKIEGLNTAIYLQQIARYIHFRVEGSQT